jgi:hypothetical protein
MNSGNTGGFVRENQVVLLGHVPDREGEGQVLVRQLCKAGTFEWMIAVALNVHLCPAFSPCHVFLRHPEQDKVSVLQVVKYRLPQPAILTVLTCTVQWHSLPLCCCQSPPPISRTSSFQTEILFPPSAPGTLTLSLSVYLFLIGSFDFLLCLQHQIMSHMSGWHSFFKVE